MKGPSLPLPAKGRGGENLTEFFEAMVTLLHAAQHFQAKRLNPRPDNMVPMLIYISQVMTVQQPERTSSPMTHTTTIAKLSQNVKWSTWFINISVLKHNYRQEAADGKKTEEELNTGACMPAISS